MVLLPHVFENRLYFSQLVSSLTALNRRSPANISWCHGAKTPEPDLPKLTLNLELQQTIIMSPWLVSSTSRGRCLQLVSLNHGQQPTGLARELGSGTSGLNFRSEYVRQP